MPKNAGNTLIPDFGGWATVYNVLCKDGRTIRPQAFSHMDGHTVPIVWQHSHSDVGNLLGHGILEENDSGMYIWGFLNKTQAGLDAKEAISHGDIDSLSIWANDLTEAKGSVTHGVIREVSLVLSGANDKARIDYVAIQHGDGMIIESTDEAIIYSAMPLEFPIKEENQDLEVGGIMAHSGKTINDVFETLNEDQKMLFYSVMSTLLEDGEGSSVEMSDDSISQGETMKKNVFDGSGNTPTGDMALLHRFDFAKIMELSRQTGSFKTAFLAHAETYGIGDDREQLELLFPDATAISSDPTWIARQMDWVNAVLQGTHHTPFSRIKSLHADITGEEARARGYITGNEKISEVFPVLRRTTGPTTIYKKQKLDRDDIIDITDFDVVIWLKKEMRLMLNEELARAILVGDGRDPVTQADDKINEECIRPIWGDSSVYVHYEQVPADHTADELIDSMILSVTEYRGSGSPTCFTSPSQKATWMLLRDGDGRRLYRSEAELATELGVTRVVAVPVMENATRTVTISQTDYTYELKAIIVNLNDYTVGADRGGEISFFDDFDIDFNQQKYLLETRASGALVNPKSAIVLEQLVEGD